MKIALVIDHLDPRRGGAEQWTYQHAEGLIARGHEVHVVAQDVGGPAARLNLTAHRLGSIRSVLARAAAAEQRLRGMKFDMIHDIGMGWHSNVLQSEDGSRLAQWAQKLKALRPWQRPLKRAMINMLPRYRDFRTLMERQFGDPQRIVVAVSQMCANDYQRFHDVPENRIRLVYHGTDNERFSPEHRNRYREEVRDRLHLCDDEVAMLFVGHDYHRKGLATAIRAVRRLAAEGARVRLLVVGGKRRETAGHPNEDAHVTFVGPIDDPVPFYAASDLFVLPTFYDPCSLSVSEAAASGLPNVTTRFNGAAELLTEGVDGRIMNDPADDIELANCLRPMMDPSVREPMGVAARKLALEHSLDHNCDQIIEIYQELVGVHCRAA